MKNATLVIHNNDKFEDDIWQTSDDNFSENEWSVAISNFADTCQAILDWIDELNEYDEVPLEQFDPYILGDTINMLRSIDVKVERD